MGTFRVDTVNTPSAASGISISISTKDIKAFRRAAVAASRYTDVTVSIDGTSRTFSINEFRRILGMERRED